MRDLLNTIRQTAISWLHSPLVHLYTGNSILMLISRAAWMIQALTVGIYVTRVLGPARLGQFNYSLSVIGLMTIFMMLQCDDVIIRHLIRAPSMHRVLIGSCALFKLFTFLLSGVMLCVTIFLAPKDPVIRQLIVLFYLMNFFGVLNTITLYFTAESKIRYFAYASLITCVFYSIVRLIAAFADIPLVWYGVIEISKDMLITLILWIFYWREGRRFRDLRYDRRVLKCIFRASLPLFLVSLSGTLYAKTDIVMLKHFRDSETVGYYSLACRCVENLNLIIGLLVPVFVPVLFQSAKISEELFRRQFHRLYFMMFWLMAGLTAGTELIAWPVIRFFYGTAFLPTVPLLRIFVLTLLYASVSSVLGQWIIKTNRLFLGGLFNLSGFLINVPLNCFLILRFGAAGAAWSTLLSAPIGMVIIMMTFPEGRAELKFLLKSILTLPSFHLSR